MKIFKYLLANMSDIDDYVEVKAPESFRPLTVGFQDDDLVVWALVDETQSPDTTYLFRVAGTGHTVMNEDTNDRVVLRDPIHQYMNTFRLNRPYALVLHVFFLGEGELICHGY